MSMDSWMDKEKVVYSHTMERYSALKEILQYVKTWMNLKDLYEVKQASHGKI